MHTLASPGATFSIFASTSPSCADCPTSPCPPAPPRPAAPPRPPSPSRLTPRASPAASSASPAGRSSHCPPASAGAAPSLPAAPSTTTGLSSPSPRSRCPSSHAVSGGCRFTTVSAGRPCACTACSNSCSEPTKCGSQPRTGAMRPTTTARSSDSSSTRRFTRGLSSRRLVRGCGAVGDLVTAALYGLLQVGERLRQQDRVRVAVVKEGHLPDAHRQSLRTALGSFPEGDLLDVGADPLGHAQGVAAGGVKQDHGDGRRELPDEVGRPHELRDLLGERSLDLFGDLLPVTGDVGP